MIIRPCTIQRVDTWAIRRRRFLRLRVAILRARLHFRTWRNSREWLELALAWTVVLLIVLGNP